MKRRPYPATSAEQRRNADLFFTDLMGSPSHSSATAEAREEADQFLADLLGQQTETYTPVTLPAEAYAPAAIPAQAYTPAALPAETFAPETLPAEDVSEKQPCPDGEEVTTTWQALAELRKLITANQKEMESNPLIIEVQMLKQLTDVLDMANDVPAKVWGEIWDELKAFASCDVKPLVARVKGGEKHANAVLRVLNGFTSILQGYVHDRIDAQFKTRLEAQSGWSKAVAKLIIHVIKKQVPVIQREIKAKNFAAVSTALEDLKTQLNGQGFSVTGVWDVIVALGKEIIGSAIEDAVQNTARWAAKKVAKKLLGSAAKAASIIFILEDIAYFVHALVTISDHNARVREYNRVLIGFLRRVRPCVAARAGGTYTTPVFWKIAIARLDCQVVLHSFARKKDGKPGQGTWHSTTVPTTFDAKTASLTRIEIPAGETQGKRVLKFKVPPVAQWPSGSDSYLSLDVIAFGSSGNIIRERNMFVAACVP